jgi:hypothetical protein
LELSVKSTQVIPLAGLLSDFHRFKFVLRGIEICQVSGNFTSITSPGLLGSIQLDLGRNLQQFLGLGLSSLQLLFLDIQLVLQEKPLVLLGQNSHLEDYHDLFAEK